MSEEEAFLGVSRSLTGRRWRARPAEEGLVQGHRRALALEEPLARAMAARGVALEDGERFLRPTLKALFPDPSCFADMALAARLLVDALETDRSIAVFADYDVDGATSAALLVRWFRKLGKDLPIVVPDRVTEGYGPSPAAFRRLREQGVELVVTVDCGAAAHEALHEARRVGLEVIVVDHHLMRGKPPPAAALVNPNRPDCASGQGVLAAAGVTFVLLAAPNREARARGLFTNRPEPDLIAWLDLAALGAICDVTRLVGFNRAIAAQGLKVMARWGNPGLIALRQAAGSSCVSPGVFEAGFLLGPRINAGGRIGRSDLGARLLSTDDPAEAEAIAAELHVLNAERRSVEDVVLAEAKSAIEAGNLDPEAAALVVAGDDWHPGVIGIVASRLREAHRRPVIVIGVDRAGGIAKGSGRSQPGVNLGAAVQAAFDEGLLLAGGGHAMAAGLTIRPGAIPEFRAFLCERLAGEMGRSFSGGRAGRGRLGQRRVRAQSPGPVFRAGAFRPRQPRASGGPGRRPGRSAGGDAGRPHTAYLARRLRGAASGDRLAGGGDVARRATVGGERIASRRRRAQARRLRRTRQGSTGDRRRRRSRMR